MAHPPNDPFLADDSALLAIVEGTGVGIRHEKREREGGGRKRERKE